MPLAYRQFEEACPLRTPQDRDAADLAIEPLAVRDESELSEDERDNLDVLSELIDAYDRANHPMPRRRGTAHQRLLALVESSHTTPSKLQKILALSQPQVSLILAGKRGLSKTSALRLARHFNLGTDYFLQDQ